MTDKINYDSMKKLFDEQLRTFVQKNSDYGNSFERSLESHGLLAGIVRMEDKMNRLSTLAPGDKDAQISSESLSDTLMDLSNYATMTAAWLNSEPQFGFSEEFVHQDIASIYPELITRKIATTVGDISLYTSLKNADRLCKKQCNVKGLEDAIFFCGIKDYDLNYSSLNYFVDVNKRYYAIIGLDSGFIKYIVMQMINNDMEFFNKYDMCKDGAKYNTVREFLGTLLTNIKPEKEISIVELEPEIILPIVKNLKYYQEVSDLRHDDKVNEREHFNGVLSDHTIIKNWVIVGDTIDNIQTIRSRTTGQYLKEDDNPELFRKICGVLMAYHGYANFKKMKDKLTGADEEFEGRFNDLKETVFEQINRSREVVTTELKGLENGYVIRQHKNTHNSYRYTLAFNPEGTLKIEGEVAKPYVIECFSNDHDGTNTWAIHICDTREDMVAALNYDLRVRRPFESKNFGDSIKELDVKVSVFTHFDVPKVLGIWDDTFGEAFNNQMLSKNLNTEESIEKYQGIKTFGPVFISEKTGALVVKGVLRDRTTGQNNNIIWFSDTKEVLLELKNTIPKFNDNGIIYGIDSKHVKNGDNLEFNPLYQTMEDKILSKFYSCDETELKNLVFFNEDEAVSCEFMDKKFQIPNDSPSANAKNTVGLDNFGALESGNLTSKNDKLQIDFTDSKVYWGE